jgi:GNAT superfamily N-acetyltransferase
MFRSFVVFLFLISVSNSSFAKLKCFDALDPKDIHFTANLQLPVHRAYDFGIRIFYKRQDIGFVMLGPATSDDEGQGYASIAVIAVRPEFENQGVGTLLYYTVAKYCHQRWNLILQKSTNASAKADRVWQRLYEKGLATHDGKFEKHALTDDPRLEESHQFFLRFTLQDHKTLSPEFSDGTVHPEL